jgi:hypothetical protein
LSRRPDITTVAGLRAELAKKPHKYGAISSVVDGHKFPSKREATRYGHLKRKQLAGDISGLTLQPKFALIVNGVNCGSYIGDFEYLDCRTGKKITEDSKGFATPVYKLKKKLVMAIYGIEIKEV